MLEQFRVPSPDKYHHVNGIAGRDATPGPHNYRYVPDPLRNVLEDYLIEDDY